VPRPSDSHDYYTYTKSLWEGREKKKKGEGGGKKKRKEERLWRLEEIRHANFL